MNDIFSFREFAYRGGCVGWTKELLIFANIADFLIFAAYVGIGLSLLWAYKNIGKFSFQMNKTLIAWYGFFILSCGGGHWVEVAMTWWPAWRFDVLWDWFTAFVSWISLIVTLNSIKVKV